MAALFPIEDCSLSSIPLVDFEFNSACEVLPAPPPIFDQPDIEIPLDFPPQPVIIPPIATPRVCVPCPTLNASAGMDFTTGDTGGVDVAVTPLTSAGSCDSDPDCRYQFDFNFQFPCVDVSATADMHWTDGSSASAAPVPVSITRTPPTSPGSPCRYHFDFDFTAIIQSTLTSVFEQVISEMPCMPQPVFFTLTSDLNSGGTASASSTDGAITISDANALIPAGQKITSGAKGWAWRECTGGGFTYSLAVSNRCPRT